MMVNIKIWADGEYRYIYGYLKEIRPNKYRKNIVEAVCMININGFVSERHFNIQTKLLLESLIPFRIFKEEPSEEEFSRFIASRREDLSMVLEKKNMVINAFIANRYGYPEIYKLGLFESSSRGLYVESSHERRFYDMHCDNDILFYKPHERIPLYDGGVPDLMYPHGTKYIFGEVFGFNEPDYLERRAKKISLIENELKDTHHLIYWDAYKGKNEAPMPTAEEIKDILSRIGK